MITPSTDGERNASNDILPTGAYVIRNKEIPAVIHIAKPDVAFVTCATTILAHKRDEINHRDQQIWWVERLPDDEEVDDCDGAVYSITNTASGLGLDVDRAQTNNGSPVCAFPPHGGYNQRWRLPKLPDASSEEERTIVGVASGRVLAFEGVLPAHSNALHIWDPRPENARQRWEFIKPVVAVPAGWVEIINLKTGDVLSQTYLSSPPRLIRPQEPRNQGLPPSHRERWNTQWTIVTPSSHQQHGGESSDTWIITNRLTGGRLRYAILPYKGEHKLSVVAVMGQRYIYIRPKERWIIEYVDDNIWKIRSQESLCYLEETMRVIGKGSEVACISKSFKRGESEKTWSFRKVMDP